MTRREKESNGESAFDASTRHNTPRKHHPHTQIHTDESAMVLVSARKISPVRPFTLIRCTTHIKNPEYSEKETSYTCILIATITTMCTVRAKEERQRNNSGRAIHPTYSRNGEEETQHINRLLQLHAQHPHRQTPPQNTGDTPTEQVQKAFKTSNYNIYTNPPTSNNFLSATLLIQNKIRELCYPPPPL